MGFYFTPWVSDMLDMSGGFGSWNLSMNQGLAHMQATSYMNSCWGFGNGFMPYSSFTDGLGFLLDPSYAMWQTMTGNNSGASIFGGGFGNFGNFANPWSIGNGGGGTGSSGNSNLTPEEREKKTNFESIRDMVKEYANYLKNNGDTARGDNLISLLNDLEKNKDKSWLDKYTEAKTTFENILTHNKDEFIDFMSKNTKMKLSVGMFRNTDLATLIKSFGISVSGTTYTGAKLENLALDGTNANASTLQSITKANIIETLSKYNSDHGKDLITEFVDQYKNLKDEGKESSAITTGLDSLIEKLVERAGDIKSSLTDDAKVEMETAISNLTGLVKNKNNGNRTITDPDKLKTAFNKLYAKVRLAEVQKLEVELDHKCKDMSSKKMSELLDLTNQTRKDLAKELYGNESKTSDVNALVGKVDVTAHQDGVDVTQLNTPSASGNGSSVVSSSVEKDFEDRYAGAFERTSIKVNNKVVYRWTSDDPCDDEIQKDSLFVVGIDGTPKAFNDEEKLEYGVILAKDNSKKIGGKTYYVWQGPSDGTGLKEGDICDIKDGAPVLVAEWTQVKFKGKTVYSWKGTDSGELKKEDPCIIDNGKMRKLTDEEFDEAA